MRLTLLALIAGLLCSCSDKNPTPGAAPNYQTMHHLTFKGAMFHFNHEGNYYIGCSIHQGGIANGAQLLRDDQENAVVIKKRVHKQKDLHVWTYDESTLSPETALPYLGDPDIRVGDRIYILNKKRRIAATVRALPQGNGYHYGYQTFKPFPAGGMSGSPVFSVRTGTVVGVLQTANSKTKATMGGFEALKMP
ncbi:serine protease [Akkermansiaceae bacterium]|nr:serine protease [Akkermansiaceae bacterium]